MRACVRAKERARGIRGRFAVVGRGREGRGKRGGEGRDKERQRQRETETEIERGGREA